jgi:hypothetical protein
VLELLLRLVFGGVRFAGFSLQNEHHQIPAAIAMMHGPINIRFTERYCSDMPSALIL